MSGYQCNKWKTQNEENVGKLILMFGTYIVLDWTGTYITCQYGVTIERWEIGALSIVARCF